MVAKKKCYYAVGEDSSQALIFCGEKRKCKDRFCKRHREMIDKNIFSDDDYSAQSKGATT